MTYEYEFSGLGTEEQTLTVYGPGGDEVGSVTQESFTWQGDYPDEVADTLPETTEALMALQRDDIVQRGTATAAESATEETDE